jgi:hypothetical protein
MALNTLKGIHKEMARVYRLSLAGTLPSGEMTRLIFGLRELRQTVEAQAEAAVLNLEARHTPISFVIYCVPPGTQVDPNDSSKFVWPDGSPCAAPDFKPYEATPSFEMLPAPIEQLDEPEPPIPVTIDLEAAPVTRLDTWRSRRHSDDDPPGVA